MWTVLNNLGFDDCYHMLNMLKNPPDADMWTEAVNAKYFGKGIPFAKEDWDGLLGNCQVSHPRFALVPSTIHVVALMHRLCDIVNM